MKQFQMPVCRQQKQFEDLAQTLVKITADLMEENQNMLLEYAMKLHFEEKEKREAK